MRRRGFIAGGIAWLVLLAIRHLPRADGAGGHPRGCRGAVAAVPALLGADVRLGPREPHDARELAARTCDGQGDHRLPLRPLPRHLPRPQRRLQRDQGRKADLQLVVRGSDLRRRAGQRRPAVRRAELHAVGPGGVAEAAPVLVQAAAEPAKSYEKWGKLVGAFTRHLVERYGIEEVRQWYFEVWNEPNIDFWTGKPAKETYFELYDAAARAVKAVDGRLRVGGPATAQAAWTGDFIRHCVEKDIPVDFVTTHVYGNRQRQGRPAQRREGPPVRDGGPRRAEGPRRGQGLAPAGVADHLVRVQRDLHEPGRGHGFRLHGPVAGEQHPPVRRHDDHHGLLVFLGRLRGTGRGEEAVLRRLWPDRGRAGSPRRRSTPSPCSIASATSDCRPS